MILYTLQGSSTPANRPQSVPENCNKNRKFGDAAQKKTANLL